MKTWMKPADNYVEITPHGNVVISCAESRQLLAQIGIAGEIIHTPGHSDDSISLLLDGGQVFTGDLPPPARAFDNPVALATWRFLKEKGATQVYPAHGPIWPLDGETLAFYETERR
jgi:glyoxylase-like metal-dependent hydrolase (beta-lactamase superfamily II)